MTRKCTAVCDHPYREQRLELGDILGHDPLGHRIVMALARAGILTREQLAAVNTWDVPALRFGPKSTARIRHALKETP